MSISSDGQNDPKPAKFPTQWVVGYGKTTENERSSDYGTVINAGYYVTPNAKVFAEFTYSKYDEGKGCTQIIDKNSGDSVSIGGDAAGISNRNYTITAGLQYRFWSRCG